MGNSSGSPISRHTHNKQNSSLPKDKLMHDPTVRDREVTISSDISSNSYIRNAAGQHSYDTAQTYAFLIYIVLRICKLTRKFLLSRFILFTNTRSILSTVQHASESSKL